MTGARAISQEAVEETREVIGGDGVCEGVRWRWFTNSTASLIHLATPSLTASLGNRLTAFKPHGARGPITW